MAVDEHQEHAIMLHTDTSRWPAVVRVTSCVRVIICTLAVILVLGDITSARLPPPALQPDRIKYHSNFTTRYDLYFQLVREVMSIMYVDTSVAVPRSSVEATRMRQYVEAGFLLHNFTKEAAEVSRQLLPADSQLLKLYAMYAWLCMLALHVTTMPSICPHPNFGPVCCCTSRRS